MVRSRFFELLAWLPAAVLVGLKIYVAQFEGWGAWAAAPLFLIPLALSLVIGLVGVVLYVRKPAEKRKELSSIGLMLLPWGPIIYFVVAYYWRQLMMPA